MFFIFIVYNIATIRRNLRFISELKQRLFFFTSQMASFFKITINKLTETLPNNNYSVFFYFFSKHYFTHKNERNYKVCTEKITLSAF